MSQKKETLQQKQSFQNEYEKDFPVRCYTEWDQLEEIIVGSIDSIRVPEWDQGLNAVIPKKSRFFFKNNYGKGFPDELVKEASKEVNNLTKVLEDLGVVVRRPEKFDQNFSVKTPTFTTKGGFHSAMPRDCLFVVGNTLIEVPMAWRSRYFETFAFREILKDYFRRGAKWISAPKPTLSDELWNPEHKSDTGKFNSAISEFEPVFDAADFIKVGKDIIGQRSHVTNNLGIEWLQSTLGDDYNISIYEFTDDSPMHIDTTILPLAPGKVLVNPIWVNKLPDIFKHWDVFYPPKSSLSDTHPLYMTSKWIHMNIIMINEKTLVVEKDEAPLIRAFQNWGFDVIKVPFKHFQSFGGSFHCATLDIRRRGELKSYV